MSLIEREFDKLIIVFVLGGVLGLMVVFQNSHDIVVFLMGVITTLIGCITTLTKSNDTQNKNAIISRSSKSASGNDAAEETKVTI